MNFELIIYNIDIFPPKISVSKKQDREGQARARTDRTQDSGVMGEG
jgi:hypothetical protein